MALLTIQTTNAKAAVHLIQSAFTKKAAFLCLGIEKTKARIAHFEEKYGCSLQELSNFQKESNGL
jgi:hypothetical protein